MFYRLVNQCTVYFAAHITMYVFINCKYKRQGVKKNNGEREITTFMNWGKAISIKYYTEEKLRRPICSA